MKKIHQIRLKYRLAYTKALEENPPAEEPFKPSRERDVAGGESEAGYTLRMRREAAQAKQQTARKPVQPKRQLPKPPQVKPIQREKEPAPEVDWSALQEEEFVPDTEVPESPSKPLTPIQQQQQAFVQEIEQNLADATPRLVYADWLEEHGDQQESHKQRVLGSKIEKREFDEVVHTVLRHILDGNIGPYANTDLDPDRDFTPITVEQAQLPENEDWLKTIISVDLIRKGLILRGYVNDRESEYEDELTNIAYQELLRRLSNRRLIN